MVVPASASASAATARCSEARAQLDAYLEEAYDAVARGDTDGVLLCEATVARILASCPEPCTSPEDCLATTADELILLAELTRTSEGEEQLEVEQDLDTELTPELQPSAPELVAEESARAAAETFDLPVEVNPTVASLIEYYTGPYRERFLVAMGRAGRYLPFIREEFRGAGLPMDLAYLPFVESAFNPQARSRAHAQGLWQFMKGTGRLYGLRTDGLVDERNDPFLATKAAVAHLGELHEMFGSWELALAAYNSGAGRVQRALRRGRGETDYWALRRHLPRETRGYVPALWAVLVIVKNLEAYGFQPILEQAPCIARVPVDGALDTDVLAERAGIPGDTLAELNPALIYRLTPERGRSLIAVPCELQEKVTTALASIPPEERIRTYLHAIRKGDTMGAIANRYGSSVDAIASANPGVHPRRLRIGQVIVVPRSPRSVSSARPVTVARRAPAPAIRPVTPGRSANRYTVRAGDTLYTIAQRHGLSVTALKRANGLRSNLIRPGDVLVLSQPRAGS